MPSTPSRRPLVLVMEAAPTPYPPAAKCLRIPDTCGGLAQTMMTLPQSLLDDVRSFPPTQPDLAMQNWPHATRSVPAPTPMGHPGVLHPERTSHSRRPCPGRSSAQSGVAGWRRRPTRMRSPVGVGGQVYRGLAGVPAARQWRRGTEAVDTGGRSAQALSSPARARRHAVREHSKSVGGGTGLGVRSRARAPDAASTIDGDGSGDDQPDWSALGPSGRAEGAPRRLGPAAGRDRLPPSRLLALPPSGRGTAGEQWPVHAPSGGGGAGGVWQSFRRPGRDRRRTQTGAAAGLPARRTYRRAGIRGLRPRRYRSGAGAVRGPGGCSALASPAGRIGAWRTGGRTAQRRRCLRASEGRRLCAALPRGAN